MESQHDRSGDVWHAVDAASRHVVGSIRLPRWYSVAVAALLAQHVVAVGGSDEGWESWSGFVLFVGCAAAWLLWRHQMGITIWPVAGPSSAFALGAWSVAGLLCVQAAGATDHRAVVGVVVVIAATSSAVLGRVWGAALRRDLSAPRRWAT